MGSPNGAVEAVPAREGQLSVRSVPLRRTAPGLVVTLLALALPASTLALTWASPVKLTSTRNAVGYFGLATTGSSGVHVVFEEARGGVRGVYYRRSTNGGATWAPGLRLSDPESEYSTLASVSSMGSFVDVVWRDDVNDEGDVVWYRRSIDQGATWKPPVRLNATGTLPGSPSILHDSTGRVLVMWTNLVTGAIQFRVATNNGANWGPIKSLATSTHKGANGRFEALPAVASGAGVWYVAWLSGTAHLYVQRSTDGGATWSTKVALTMAAFGDVPTIAATGSSAVVAYSESSATAVWVATRGTSTKGSSWASRVVATSTAAGSLAFNPVARYAGGAWRLGVERCATIECLSSGAWYRQSTNGGASWSTLQKVSTSSRPYATPDGIGYAGRVLFLYHDQDPALLDSDVYIRSGI